VARALLSALGEPIAAPSANRYQGLSPTLARHVSKELGDAVDLVLDGGACEAGVESTVVDVRESPLRVLRPGAAGLDRLRALASPELVEVVGRAAAADEARASPGMDERHYAPRARLVLAASSEEAWSVASAIASSGKLVGLVVLGSVTRAGHEGAGPGGVLVRPLPTSPEAYARRMYGTLHELDDAGVSVIVAEAVPAGDGPEGEAWLAVADRQRRGASSQ
jgi:L-threonylcarbamoyladenylate synthase